jgi:hypothetical protein
MFELCSTETIFTSNSHFVLSARCHTVSGTQSKPVTGLTFSGVAFIDAAPAYLEPHGTPSGGDWAISRSAALFMQGTVVLVVVG